MSSKNVSRTPPAPSAIAAAAPNFVIAVFFLSVWIAPSWYGPSIALYTGGLMFLEFVAILSSTFMGAAASFSRWRPWRVLVVAALGVVFSYFITDYAPKSGMYHLLELYWMLVAGRIVMMLTGSYATAVSFLALGFVNGFLLVITLMPFIVLPVPALGMTDQVVEDMRRVLDAAGGIKDLTYEVRAVVCWGFLYFSLSGWALLRVTPAMEAMESEAPSG